MTEPTAATADLPNLPAGAPAAAGEEVFVFPASSGQRRLWFIDRLEPGSPLYNIPLALRLTGGLDEPALAAALAEIVRRHEALRTTFDVEDDEPVQVVAPPGAFHVETIDLAAMPAAERREEARRLAAAEAARPFDLERGPLLRATLLRLGGEVPEHHLLLTLHHIVADGWSLSVLAQELSALYAARRGRRSSPLPELPIQYADFAAWQRERLESGLRAEQMAYWRAQLGDAPRLLELPLARPRPAVRSHAGRRAVRALPAAAAAALRELCHREGVTPFMALFAAFQALLARTTGQRDLIVGTPIANRGAAETEGLIGLFVNTLALRVRVESGAGFRALLHQVRDAAVAAYAHQDLPFEELVEELAPERSLSHHPLVQAVFGMGDGAGTAPELAGLLVEPLAGEHGTVKFDLALTVEEGAGGLVARLDGSADLYDAAALARLLASFAALLEAALAAPERRLGELPLWDAALAHRTLVEWNDTAAALPEGGSALALFARAAAGAPEAPALLAAAGDAPEVVTYGALDRWSDRLAGRLRGLMEVGASTRRGAGPETRVAVAMEHAPARIAALLAVWKAGGAYVSLDPADPAERRAFQLADCGAPLLLVAAGARVEAPEGVRVVEVEACDDGSGEEGEEATAAAALPPLPDADRLAYVIYTSGSSGRPKGVEITHGGLLNLVAWHQAAYGVTAADRATQLAGVGFDASVWELWPYLAAGAALAIPPADLRADPARLVPWLADQGVTLAFLPTALAELALAEPWPAGAPLRALLVGGDRLHRPPPAVLPFRLVNHYGPTECSVVATCGDVEPAPADAAADAAAPPPIGRPISNTRLVLVDADGQPVPPGVPGELWLGGAGLARGYLGRPDLTAERFVPDPFSGEAGRAPLPHRRPRSGCCPDGAVEFLGRIDQQVKVRGFRIELGEIEAALAACPGVREAAVVAREDARGRQAAGRLRGAGGGAAAGSRPRCARCLRERLPEYMVPAAFVALPAPAAHRRTARWTAGPCRRRRRWPAPRARARRRSLPPRSCWPASGPRCCGLERVGRRRRLLRPRRPLAAARPRSPRACARPSASSCRCARSSRRRRWRTSPPAVEAALRAGAGRRGSAARARCRATARLPALLRPGAALVPRPLEPGSPAYNMPAALRLRGRARPGRPARRASREVVRRHEALRTAFAADPGGGPGVAQVIAPALALPLPLVDLAAADGEAELGRLAAAEAARPFDLARGPLLRATLLRLARRRPRPAARPCTTSSPTAGRWACCCASWRPSTARPSPAPPSPLPPLAVQYADFAVWQRRLAGRRGAGAAARLLARGARGRAAGAGAARRPAAPGGAELPRRARRGSRLPPEPAAALAALGRRRGATLFMALLAGFQTLLPRFTGQRRPRSSARRSPTATRREVEGLIGFFVNTLVLRGRPVRRPAVPRAARAAPARRRSPPTPTRTCRSRSWSRSCSREREPDALAALPGHVRCCRTRRWRRRSCRGSPSSRSRSRARPRSST